MQQWKYKGYFITPLTNLSKLKKHQVRIILDGQVLAKKRLFTPNYGKEANTLARAFDAILFNKTPPTTFREITFGDCSDPTQRFHPFHFVMLQEGISYEPLR